MILIITLTSFAKKKIAQKCQNKPAFLSPSSLLHAQYPNAFLMYHDFAFLTSMFFFLQIYFYDWNTLLAFGRCLHKITNVCTHYDLLEFLLSKEIPRRHFKIWLSSSVPDQRSNGAHQRNRSSKN